MATAVFRTDASRTMGTGHAMRCLTLADALRTSGTTCRFLCRELDGHLIEVIRARGHAVATLPKPAAQPAPLGASGPPHTAWLGVPWEQDAAESGAALQGERPDWLVIDHYALDRDWEAALRPHATHLFVIDDLADRPHDCDLLLDQNLGREPDDYRPLVPSGCPILAGTRFALLRPEFIAGRAAGLARRGDARLEHILVSLGGVDASNMTGEVLEALGRVALPRATRITVLMGRTAPWTDSVRRVASRLPCPVTVLVGAENVAPILVDADLAIGAAGSSSWERCAVGLPTLILVLADNQRGAASALASEGAAIRVDTGSRLDQQLSHALGHLQKHPQSLRNMAARAAALCDGAGAMRVVRRMYSTAGMRWTLGT